MRVRLLYFGVLQDVLGEQQAEMELKAGETVAELLRLLRKDASKQSEVWTTLAVAVNRVYAGVETVLQEGDEVALLPPVSGGAEEAGAA